MVVRDKACRIQTSASHSTSRCTHTVSKRSPHERSDMRGLLDQARAGAGTAIPHVAALMRATMLLNAACALANVAPTTMAGVVGLLQYAISFPPEEWPEGVQSGDDTETRPWHTFLIEMLTAVLPG